MPTNTVAKQTSQALVFTSFCIGTDTPTHKAMLRICAGSVVLMGFGLDSDNLHSPNEKFDVANFYKA